MDFREQRKMKEQRLKDRKQGVKRKRSEGEERSFLIGSSETYDPV